MFRFLEVTPKLTLLRNLGGWALPTKKTALRLVFYFSPPVEIINSF